MCEPCLQGALAINTKEFPHARLTSRRLHGQIQTDTIRRIHPHASKISFGSVCIVLRPHSSRTCNNKSEDGRAGEQEHALGRLSTMLAIPTFDSKGHWGSYNFSLAAAHLQPCQTSSSMNRNKVSTPTTGRCLAETSCSQHDCIKEACPRPAYKRKSANTAINCSSSRDRVWWTEKGVDALAVRQVFRFFTALAGFGSA